MKKTVDTIGVIGLLLAIFTLLFGDNLYEQITGRSVFNRNDEVLAPTFIATEEPKIIYTAAALTVASQLTQNTPVVTKSSESVAMTKTSIPSATAVCNLAQFVKDMTIPDGTNMTPGQSFTKIWRVRNAGSCIWTDFSLVFDSGEAMGGTSVLIDNVNPGQEIDLVVNLIAPSSQGTYRGYWRIATNNNVMIPVLGGYQGRSIFFEIKVEIP